MLHLDDDRHPNTVDSLVYSMDGKLLASAGRDGRHVKLWDAAKGKLLHRLRGGSCAFTADGKYLFVPSFDGLEVREVASGKLREEVDIPSGGVHTMVVSPDGKSLAIGHDNGVVRVYEVKSLLAGPKGR